MGDISDDIRNVGKRLLVDCLGAVPKERLLIVTDGQKEKIAVQLFEAGRDLGLAASMIKIPVMSKSGEEPPDSTAESMKDSDIVICITERSLTHTTAKKKAAEAGARIATMPGITREMFLKGAITADYSEVEKLTEKVADVLTSGKIAVIEKEGYRLEMSIEGRIGIKSTGRYLRKGESGNLPSGEAYIAPVEGSATGKILVDGSIVGLGKLFSPILLTIDGGILTDAEGERALEWLKLLGNSKLARNVAELGIGTNHKALLTGNILEDEKILGTAHIAFGSNDTFGGRVHAGVHLDAVVLNPAVYIDDIPILDKDFI
jgi:leucyl aminopeptidase (aminopeptidase T)